MGEHDPNPLSYARAPSHRERLPYDLHAHRSFWLGLLGPTLMALIFMFTVAIFGVIAGSLGAPLGGGVVLLATLLALFVPVAGLIQGAHALQRTRAHPIRNQWQAFVGLTLHSLLILAGVLLLFRTFH